MAVWIKSLGKHHREVNRALDGEGIERFELLPKMNTGVKAVLLVVGAYGVTMGVAVFIVTLAILIMMEPHSCSTMGRALLVLWATIAAVFLASVVVVGIIARKITPGIAGRLAIVAAHGVALLASYVVIAFGLMVLFNC
jgi:hypothetical protein